MEPELIDEACAWWSRRLREHEVVLHGTTLRIPADKIERFTEELRRLLAGACRTPYAKAVHERFETQRAIDLYTEAEPRGVVAEAAMRAGFRREFVLFPKGVGIRLEPGRVRECALAP